MSEINNRVQKWRNNIKWELINALGGGCRICGYNKCKAALDFHHVDPETKNNTISKMLRNPNQKEKILKEAQKCILLCKNCHAEYHYGNIKIDHLKIIFKPQKSAKQIQPGIKCLHCKKDTFNRKYCSRACIGFGRTKIDWPDPKIVLDMVSNSSYTAVADKLNCSDVAVKKFLKRNNMI